MSGSEMEEVEETTEEWTRTISVIKKTKRVPVRNKINDKNTRNQIKYF